MTWLPTVACFVVMDVLLAVLLGHIIAAGRGFEDE